VSLGVKLPGRPTCSRIVRAFVVKTIKNAWTHLLGVGQVKFSFNTCIDLPLLRAQLNNSLITSRLSYSNPQACTSEAICLTVFVTGEATGSIVGGGVLTGSGSGSERVSPSKN